MTSILRFGSDSSVSLDLPAEVLLAQCDAPRGEPLEDPGAAVAAALAEPMNFPILAEAIIPDDKITLALEGSTPQSAVIVARVVNALSDTGILPEDITIVRTQPDTASGDLDPRRMLSHEVREKIRLLDHDPRESDQLCYMAATAENKPVYINRAIFDADMVLTIGVLSLKCVLDYHGVHGGLFPAFSDEASQKRFRSPSAAGSTVGHKRHEKEAEEVAWLLGVGFTIQIVPGAGSEILHVLAGDIRTVSERGTQLCQAAWQYRVPRRASLVLAAVEGPLQDQTWQNFSHALASASQVVLDDGAIVLCTELAAQPGPALQRIVGADDLHTAMRELVRDRPPDALVAHQLVQTLEQAKVYLLSRMNSSLVEDLGMAPVASPEEIRRLAGRHESCILLSNAQHVKATPEDEG